MTAMAYGLALMLVGLIAGLYLALWLGLVLITLGAGPILYALIRMVDTEAAHRRDDANSREDPRRHYPMV